MFVNKRVPEPDKFAVRLAGGIDVREATSDRKNMNTNNTYTCQCHRKLCSQCVQNTKQECQPGDRDVLWRTVIHGHQGQWGCIERSGKTFENTLAQSGVWDTPILFKSSHITHKTPSDTEQTLHVCLHQDSSHLHTIRLLCTSNYVYYPNSIQSHPKNCKQGTYIYYIVQHSTSIIIAFAARPFLHSSQQDAHCSYYRMH
jgi:hypothetical protein